MTDLVCFCLHAPRNLADRLSDFLLDHEAMTSEFSTFGVQFHGTELGRRSPQEQILGHAQQIQVNVLISRTQAELLITQLSLSFPGCGLTYWIGPVLRSGGIP